MTDNILFDDFRESHYYEIAFCSDLGKRDDQQDSAYCYADDQELYVVVCDGMGGLGGGELASRIGINCASRYYKTEVKNMNIPFAEEADWMAEIILKADKEIIHLKNPDGSRFGGGSTFVSAWIKNKKLYWASVGDSRIYIYRGQECVQLTLDLNYTHILKQRLARGEISEADYKKENESGEALVSFLGHGNIELIDRNIESLHLQTGDIIMVCSDGLYRTIDHEWMGEILGACEKMEDVIPFIHTIINEHGNSIQDNYTCVLIKINE